MRDVSKEKIITLSRKILNKVDRVYSQEKFYNLFFNYIRFNLKKDFKQTNLYFNPSTNQLNQNKDIPYKFWTMWWQGIEAAPLLVKNNIKKLQQYFGKQNVVVITKKNYKEYANLSKTIIDRFNSGDISHASLSDIIRFNILKIYGGYWVDSTVEFSDTFFNYFSNEKKVEFFSICNKNQNYHNISFSRWTIWFIGGVPNYGLFNYLDKFYKIYYSNHSKSIDYFLTDDVISYYYMNNFAYRQKCEDLAQNWHPYFIVSKFNSKFKRDYMSRVNDKLEYSIQKLTYKYDMSEIAQKKTTLYNLSIKDWDFDKFKN
ncbi:capsular polysaccharide synthesis protein [Lactobacillus johnsonii]|uniref:capsular polysaccharide synthesis protein n=1 Tax=Lactobacillus johnsonii TaxID=33959 RepID=UPI003DA4F814